jgi:RimJ/RimL family protein N-acetyltransferase
MEPVVIPLTSAPVAGRLPVPVSTRRLTLRRFEPGDWKPLLAIMSNEEVFRFLEGVPMDEDAVLRWLENDRAVRFTRPGQDLCLGLELTGTETLVGWASLAYRDETHLQGRFEVIVHPAFQRQGYGAEAVGGLLHLGFTGIRLHRLFAQCDSRNLAARRMLEKAGLRGEGEFVQDRMVNGEWVNTAWFALLRAEYEQWPHT